MPGTNYTVATRSQLLGEGTRQLRWENRWLENLRAAFNEPHQAQNGSNPARLDTSIEKPLSQESRRSKKDARPTEIYFSPVALDGSQVELSDPLPTPALTPTQASYDAVEAAWRAATIAGPKPRANSSAGPKWTLRAEDLDRLVVALANAPMMQQHVGKETWDSSRSTIPDRPSFMSLRSTIRDIRPIDSAVSLSSDGSAVLISPGSPVDFRRATRAKFAGLAIVESKAHEPALRFWSHHHVKNGNLMHLGKNHYLNVPYDDASKADCRLRVQTGALRSGKPSISVFMRLITPILARKTGKKVYTMITEIDVTESFQKAASTELVEQAGWNPANVVLETKTEQVRSSPSSESIDWCGLADDLQSRCDITDVVDTVVKVMSNIEPETCVMQTLTLMAELERIKRKHQDFVLARVHERYKNGVPSRMSVPWLSEHLDEKSTQTTRISSQATATFRLHVIDITAKRSFQSEPFTVQVPLAGEEKSVHFVPILDGESDKNVGWVCFLRDINDVGL